MDKLSRIFFHMYLMDTYTLGLNLSRLCHSGIFLVNGKLSRFNLHISVTAYRKIKLGYLIVLRVIRIKIILAVELAVPCDIAVGRQSDSHSIFHYLLIQNRQRSGHSRTDRAGMCIWCTAESSGTAAEDLGLRGKLHMNLKSYDGFVFFTHSKSPHV